MQTCSTFKKQKPMEKLLFLYSAWMVLACSTAAYAQESPKRLGETMFALSYEDIEVSTASNVLKDYALQPVSISIIESNQLRLSGARSLTEALTMLVPGFFAVEDQDDVIAGFRGLAPDNNSKVLLLINGQNMNTEYFWGPPDAILNSIALDYIERIEVIRGPGSVTLGQGALLGVINIITRNPEKWLGEENKWRASAKGAAGTFGLWDVHAQAAYQSGRFQTIWQTQVSSFEGEQMRNEGWVKEQENQGAAGGQVYDMNHHLRRGNYQNITGMIGLGNFKLQLGYFNSIRDLYNFYRDRDRLGNRLYSTQASYLHAFSDRTRLNVSLSYIQDHLYLESSMFDNAPMGGVREDRYGAKAILNMDQWIPQNDLAVGLEYRYFDMGKENFRGHNFIANVYGSFSPDTANNTLTMVYPSGFAMYSFLLENVFSPSPATYIVMGLRLDRHPFWGG